MHGQQENRPSMSGLGVGVAQVREGLTQGANVIRQVHTADFPSVRRTELPFGV